jgi:hypothetical protein
MKIIFVYISGVTMNSAAAKPWSRKCANMTTFELNVYQVQENWHELGTLCCRNRVTQLHSNLQLDELQRSHSFTPISLIKWREISLTVSAQQRNLHSVSFHLTSALALHYKPCAINLREQIHLFWRSLSPWISQLPAASKAFSISYAVLLKNPS